MKAMKKLSCVLLAVLLVLSLSVTAFAAEGTAATTGSITVDNAIPGMTYDAYRILDFTPVAAADTETDDSSQLKGVYTIAEGWEGFFEAPEYGAEVFNLNGIEGADEYVTPKDGLTINAEELAEAALAFAKNHEPVIKPNATATVPGDTYGADGTPANRTSTTMSDLPLGYYVVDSTAGALVALDTAGANVTMHEKNSIPQIEKEVQEDSTGDYGDDNDADVGDVVNFQTTITAERGGINYVLHDKMNDGLDFDEDAGVTVTVGGEVVLAADHWTYTYNPDGDDCTFEVVFNDAYIATLTASGSVDIVVSYQATVTDAFEVNVPEINDTYLTFGEGNTTTHDQTETYTYGFDLLKYIGVTGDNAAAAEKDPLAGAKFKLQNEDGQYAKFKFTPVEDDNNESALVVTVDGWDATGTELTTPGSGKITFKGLDADSYTVEETEAPAGYNKADPIDIEIKVNADHHGELWVGGEEAAAASPELDIPNYTGLELPETGGIGTTIFYAVGGVLVAAALVLLITKKRMTKEG